MNLQNASKREAVDESPREAQPGLRTLGCVIKRALTDHKAAMYPAVPRRQSPRRFALATVMVGAIALSGCAVLEGPTPEAPKREIPAVPEIAPELVPDGTAQDNLPYFTEVLRGYAAGDGPITGGPVSHAVADAGFDASLMQVSFDRSATGLEADNIFVSVLLGDSCLIGQVVTADRSFVTETADAVGPENNICLIGKTAPITG